MDLQGYIDDIMDSVRQAENTMAAARLMSLRFAKKGLMDDEWVDVTHEATAIQNGFIAQLKRAAEAITLAKSKAETTST